MAVTLAVTLAATLAATLAGTLAGTLGFTEAFKVAFNGAALGAAFVGAGLAGSLLEGLTLTTAFGVATDFPAFFEVGFLAGLFELVLEGFFTSYLLAVAAYTLKFSVSLGQINCGHWLICIKTHVFDLLGLFGHRERRLVSAQIVATAQGKNADWPIYTKHCSKPCNKMSLGRSMPMNTILLSLVSFSAQAGPKSLPINWCTPWKMTLRSVPFIFKTPL